MPIKMNPAFIKAVEDAAYDGIVAAAEKVRQITNDDIENGVKTGRVYDSYFFTVGQGPDRFVIPYGSRPPHQASAPGESPANDTGELVAKSVTIGYKTENRAVASWYSPQAVLMQLGTDRVEPRPFATNGLEMALEQGVIAETVAATIRVKFQ